MMQRKYFLTFLFCTATVFVGSAQNKTPADYVNPFIGAINSSLKAGSGHGLGKTFPGATTPFGAVQLSPNTITGGDNGSGYSYEHEYIEGFAFTQMSGVGWYGDLGNLLVTPTTGPLKVIAGRHSGTGTGYRSRYDKKTEKASAGYYDVTLTDHHIRAELSAAPHSGMMRFTFPRNKQSRIQIDLARRVGGTSVLQYIKVVNDHTIKGWMKCTANGGGWGNGGGKPDYTVFFYAQFSKPFKNYGVWSASIPVDQSRKREAVESSRYDSLILASEILTACKEKTGKHLGFYTEFPTENDDVVQMKSGISFVDMEGAEANLKKEIPNWEFNAVRKRAKALWNTSLSKIMVEGGTEEQKTIFYTALYHTMVDPRAVTNLDGSYMGGDDKVHSSSKFTKRSIFSGWDVFRSQFPLQTIINPVVVNDMINSLVTLAEESQNDYLERWEFLNAYSGCMVGNPAIVVINDAYQKGIRDFDIDKAYRFSKNTAEKFGNGEADNTIGRNDISRTLEYSFSEWCLSQFASSLNKKDDAALYAKRSQSYRKVFDPEKGWFRPRNPNGGWQTWPAKGRLQQEYGSTESSPYQQGWFVPHDLDGLVGLLGGKEKALEDLSALFENTRKDFLWNDYYNHANEPVHHIPFLFNRLGAPWLTQKWVREICENAYHNSVEGLVGNEDVGQMSAWYVLSSIGIHPVCPGDNKYEICSPIFNKVTIKLDGKYASGKTFTIVTTRNSRQNQYIASAMLNNNQYEKSYLTFQDIASGGILKLDLAPQPQKKWGLEL